MHNSTCGINQPKVSLEQWIVFQTVVETGSFAKAAEKLYKSQSAISYNISKLQDLIGMQLFNLNGRRSELSDIGKVILDRSKKIVAQSTQLEEAIHHLKQGVEHELIISIDELFPIELLSVALKLFEQDFPNTHVMVINHRKPVDNDFFATTKAHCAISRNKLRSDSLALLELDFHPYAHPEYALHSNQAISLPCLHHHRQIFHEGFTTPKIADDIHQCCQWQVDSLNIMIELIANKQGYGWLPNLLVEKSNLPLTPLKIDSSLKMTQSLYLTAADPTLIGKGQQSFMNILQSIC